MQRLFLRKNVAESLFWFIKASFYVFSSRECFGGSELFFVLKFDRFAVQASFVWAVWQIHIQNVYGKEPICLICQNI